MKIQFENIPEELQTYRQWCCWNFEESEGDKPTKVPYSPITKQHASVTDPTTWCTFAEARYGYENEGYSGIGFIFSNADPFSGIDLDHSDDPIKVERQIRIEKEFNSYSEISPSGKGLHIIVRGKVPSGRRRDAIELYPHKRFFTFTGHVYTRAPIRDAQEKLVGLWDSMGSSSPNVIHHDGSTPQTKSDEQVIAEAANAANGDKFGVLHRGEWKGLYQSQSEADFAYIDMLSFYTQNRDQIIRLYKNSVLGNTDKKRQRIDYVDRMVNRSFDRMVPLVDFDGLRNLVEDQLNEVPQSPPHNPEAALTIASTVSTNTVEIPPGLMGDIAQYIYAASPRPVPEIALAGAIGLMAGICGRAFNISRTGLNQYVLLLAQCHAKGTKILMYDGSTKNVEDIRDNDLVMGPDSWPRRVLRHGGGRETMVRITPTKGEPFVVNLNHVLSLKTTNDTKLPKGLIENIKVKDYMQKIVSYKHTRKLWRTGVKFSEKKLPLDPWFLGAMLGDGQLGSRIALTSMDDCIREKAKLVIEKLNMKVATTQVVGNKAFQDSYVKNAAFNNLVNGERKSELQLILQNLGLWLSRSGNKFIPEIYKTASREQRLQILAGLIDTDGHLVASRTSYEFVSKSKQLSNDVVFIARSLGFAAYMKEVSKFAQNGTGGIYHRVYISGDVLEIPVTLEYKKAPARLQKKSVLVTGFKYEVLEEDDYYGFELDGDHLYLTGDFIVHHNTGVGKEAMASGIDKLMNAIAMTAPASKEFIGPSEIASGQALVKHLNRSSQCFVSLLGEFGLRLQSMSSNHANSAEISLRRMLLELYNRSGEGQIFRSSIYADVEKNTQNTSSPAFSILGESTPERFYGALNEDMISEGLLPRFSIIEYLGQRPPLNRNHVNVYPPDRLVQDLGALAAHASMLSHQKRVLTVNCNDDAQAMLDKFDRFCDMRVNSTAKDVLRQLWNRAHIKVLKLSALVAVGCNSTFPVVTEEHVQWAMKLIESDIRNLSMKFDSGEVGQHSHENKQIAECIRIVNDYIIQPWDKIKGYCKRAEALHKDRIIPYEYLQKRLAAQSSFQNDRNGATAALRRTIQTMIDSDRFREVQRSLLADKYGSTQRGFMISDKGLLG